VVKRNYAAIAVAACLVFTSGPIAAQMIPLCPGLTIVTAVNQSSGDYESIKTIESVGPTEMRFTYSSESPPGLLSPGDLVKTTVHRKVLTRDLDAAHAYQQIFLEKSDETIPGTTSLGASAAMLRELKTKGQTEFQISNAYGGLELSADRSKSPNYYAYQQMTKIARVGSAPVNVKVLINDRTAELPAIRAAGESVGDKVEFLFLDDERNPLALAFRIGIGGIKPLTPDQVSFCETLRKVKAPVQSGYGLRCDLPNGGDRDTLRVIKITYRCAAPGIPTGGGAGTGTGQLQGGTGNGASSGSANALEQALGSTGKADVYSIYFSFNSDVIRGESEPTLKDIAEVMKRHPAWRLAVNGHTDNIGGDQSNLDLSKRRSAAVKDALVKRYAIDPNRLATSGLGKAQPKDTNDTLEGRSHNRRVELVKVG